MLPISKPLRQGFIRPAYELADSALDTINLISNDAHSPAKMGREANIFDTDMSYNSIASRN